MSIRRLQSAVHRDLAAPAPTYDIRCAYCRSAPCDADCRDLVIALHSDSTLRALRSLFEMSRGEE